MAVTATLVRQIIKRINPVMLMLQNYTAVTISELKQWLKENERQRATQRHHDILATVMQYAQYACQPLADVHINGES